MKLAKRITSRMTPVEERVGDPDKIGVLARSEAEPLSEAWCVEQIASGASTTTMAAQAGISEREMFAVLCEYGLAHPEFGGPHIWDIERCRGKRG